ncbi:CHAD domain-containing protein [Streptomyces nigrescens]|uniref:CHAD domain-containing protein n=1 Tax=Streptomyces nigrescens TaxID=1920 RepID=A0ABN6R8H6_STRNI|nr:CHAD domain-containing protein [Streptomyces nigrescens]BDM72934.1 CHAD domain-containing protein [Streptomyces nigrescens]
MAQRPDQRTGGPAGLLGTGCEPGGAAGARAAVVDGPYGPYGPPVPYDDPAAGAGAGPHLAGRTAEDVLAGYLHQQSADFLRGLRLHRESGPDAEGAGAAARGLRRAARRISATLHTFRPLTEEAWADQLLAELGWLSGTLAREQACAARRDRLMAALTRLTGRTDRPERGTDRAPRTGRGARTERAEPPGGTRATGARNAGARNADARDTGARRTEAPDTGPAEGREAEVPDADAVLAAGAARAGALLDRQLTLARTRAHSAALQALGSSRFHAVADSVAVLASEVPLIRAAADVPAAEALPPLAEQSGRRLAEAVGALPLVRAGQPYNAEALADGARQDASWHQVRVLLRLSRYAQEVLVPEHADPRLAEAARLLEGHRDAAEAAAAAAAAARTPRIAPATAYALGVLHADQRHQVEAARYAFGRVWLSREKALKGVDR